VIDSRKLSIRRDIHGKVEVSIRKPRMNEDFDQKRLKIKKIIVFIPFNRGRDPTEPRMNGAHP
jgi:hypothetical protein